MLNNFLSDGCRCDSKTISNKCEADNGKKKNSVQRIKMSPKGKFDFISDSCCSVSQSGRKMLRIKSRCRNSKLCSLSQKTDREHDR